MDLKWITQMAERINELEEENNLKGLLEEQDNKQVLDMTKPQPCTKFEDAVTVKWVAKLLEETNEVIQETPEYRTLFENGYSREYPDRAKAAKDRIALELTDVIHVCVSWLNAMGYDEDERGELHRRVNEKNKERGYF